MSPRTWRHFLCHYNSLPESLRWRNGRIWLLTHAHAGKGEKKYPPPSNTKINISWKTKTIICLVFYVVNYFCLAKSIKFILLPPISLIYLCATHNNSYSSLSKSVKERFFYTILLYIYFIPVILIPKYCLYLQLLFFISHFMMFIKKLRILSLIFIAHFKLFTFITEFL